MISMSKNKPILVIGAGISGCTIAERYANILGKKVLIIEERENIGGNCFDYFNKDGILVPKYGPHFFHTNDEDVWNYLSNFIEWKPYEHRVLSFVEGKMVPIPVNIDTINKIFNAKLSNSREAKAWLKKNVEVINRPKNSEEAAVSRVGRILYEKMFKNYTKKQWNMLPSELDPEIMNRIPVRTNFDDRYFTDKYQAMPEGGYSKLFENMLSNKRIIKKFNFNFFDSDINLKNYEKIFFTGPIDKFFNYSQGKLQYRSLKFIHTTLKKCFFQERAQINYPGNQKFTRITEPKHATGQKSKKTTIIKEYPTWVGSPFYPVINKNNLSKYEKYAKKAAELRKDGIYLVGRLAEYRYLNMDDAFKNALNLFNRLNKKQLKTNQEHVLQ